MYGTDTLAATGGVAALATGSLFLAGVALIFAGVAIYLLVGMVLGTFSDDVQAMDALAEAML